MVYIYIYIHIYIYIRTLKYIGTIIMNNKTNLSLLLVNKLMLPITTWKVSVFGVFLVQMWENVDHKNSEYGHISRSAYHIPTPIEVTRFNTVRKVFVPPDNMTPWRRLSDVSHYLPATSQVRLKWSTQWHCKEVSVLRLHDVTLKRRENVSRRCNINVSSQLSTRSQTSLKWNNQQRLSGASPIRLSSTYPRLPISKSLQRPL